MSRNKAKGTAAESAVVAWLRQWWPHTERRALSGNADRGDIAGIVGVCIEVKNHKSYSIPAWLKELDAEVTNDRADHGVLVVKPNGVGLTSVGQWWAICRLDDYARLLREAGYGPAQTTGYDPQATDNRP